MANQVETPVGTPVTAEPAGGLGRIQWGPIVAGALAGFAVTILMSTLGAAVGLSAGAAALMPATAEEAQETAAFFSIGSILWMVLTAIVVGLVGGTVLNRTSRTDRPYMPALFGGLTWTIGVLIALFLMSVGASGVLSGATAGAAGILAGQRPAAQLPGFAAPRMGDRDLERAPLTAEQMTQAREAAERAAAAATTAAWVLLGSQLISLAATLLAAGWRRTQVRRAPTELRMRPAAPTA